MKLSRTGQLALGTLVAVALLAGCSGTGGSQSSTPTTGINPASVGGHGVGVQNAHLGEHIRRSRRRKCTAILGSPTFHPRPSRCLDCSSFPTTARMTCYIFSLPAMALMGTLTGFDEPQGMCSDKAGNIWITNTGTRQIYQYSRTGTLLNTLNDPSGYPVGCAVYKANGDLAVTNLFGYPSGDGTVEVYANATGTPTAYSNPSQTENFFDAYDSNGNLYVDGFGTSGFSLSVLPNDSSTMSTVHITGGTITFPGGVNWRPARAWSLATKSAAMGLACGRSRFPARPERSLGRRRLTTTTAAPAMSIKVRSLRLASFLPADASRTHRLRAPPFVGSIRRAGDQLQYQRFIADRRSHQQQVAAGGPKP